MSNCVYLPLVLTAVLDAHFSYRMQFLLGLEIVQDIHHELLRVAHLQIIRFSRVIIRM